MVSNFYELRSYFKNDAAKISPDYFDRIFDLIFAASEIKIFYYVICLD